MIEKAKRKAKKAKSILEKANIPKIICVHLLGEEHTVHHRMGVGVITMAIGVVVAKSTSGIYIVQFVGELLGYLIHGIGSIPFVEWLGTRLPTPVVEQEEGGEQRQQEDEL